MSEPRLGNEMLKLLTPDLAGKKSEAYVAGALAVENRFAPWMEGLVAAKTLKEKRAAQRALKEELAKLRREEAETEREIGRLASERADLTYKITKIGPMIEWASGHMVLQACDRSHLHELRAAARRGTIRIPPYAGDESGDFWRSEFKDAPQTFVVQNDWAAPLSSGINLAEEEFRLPYDACCFEFTISDRSVVAYLKQIEEAIHVTAFVCADNPHWHLMFSCPFAEIERETRVIAPILSAQIRAICIALDAEVAVSDQVRAPYAENRSRAKQGLAPLLDHHVLSLAKRTRATPLEYAGAGTHRSPRLHFRRGHWRHFTDHKTWIKWMLVGNPDLGFISKEYRL